MEIDYRESFHEPPGSQPASNRGSYMSPSSTLDNRHHGNQSPLFYHDGQHAVHQSQPSGLDQRHHGLQSQSFSFGSQNQQYQSMPSSLDRHNPGHQSLSIPPNQGYNSSAASLDRRTQSYRDPSTVSLDQQNHGYPSQSSTLERHNQGYQPQLNQGYQSPTSTLDRRSEALHSPSSTLDHGNQGYQSSMTSRPQAADAPNAHGFTSYTNGDIGVGMVREAAQIVELLRQNVVYLTGGRDRRGGPVLTFPGDGEAENVSWEDLSSCVIYLASIPSKESADKGFTIIVDNRWSHYKNLKPLFKLLQDCLGSSVYAVYVVQNEKARLNLSFRREKGQFGFEPQTVAPPKLKTAIQPNQLTTDLGGSLTYRHELWMDRRLHLEKFLKEAKTVAMELDRTYLQITERLSRDDKITPQELLRQHKSLQESVIYIPKKKKVPTATLR